MNDDDVSTMPIPTQSIPATTVIMQVKRVCTLPHTYLILERNYMVYIQFGIRTPQAEYIYIRTINPKSHIFRRESE